MKRRLGLLLLAALFCMNSASAAFSPSLSQLEERYQAGEGIALAIKAALSRAQDLSPTTMETLEELLPRTLLTLRMHPEHSAQAVLEAAGQPLLSYLYTQDGDTA